VVWHVVSFYRGWRWARGGGGRPSKGGGMVAIECQPLSGEGEAGQPSKGGELKAGSTIRWFNMAQRWMVA
jgi:hypothetical protein